MQWPTYEVPSNYALEKSLNMHDRPLLLAAMVNKSSMT